MGFFESVGATEAAAVFSDEKYEEELQYTHMGEEGDATSLENMKASLDYIKECNDIRVNEEKVDPLTGEPCEELMVNDYLMATSQVSANVAAHKAEDEGVYGHSGVAPAGEILAYNYDDPYDGWYYAEKEIYERDGYTDDNWNEIGHYLIMTEGGTNSTGFGMNTATNQPIHVQQFGGEEGESMSFDEYYERFMNYYNSLMNAPEKTKEALKALEEAKAALAKAQDAEKEKEASAASAQSALDTKKQDKTDAQNRIDAAQKTIDDLTSGESGEELKKHRKRLIKHRKNLMTRRQKPGKHILYWKKKKTT